MAEIPAGPGSSRDVTPQGRGRHYEMLARRWLEKKGLRFIAANVRFPSGEIDLIMSHGEIIVFVEVRYRNNARYGAAAASITYSKQRKILRAAQRWLAGHNGSFDTVDCRCDVVAFTGNEAEWIIDAFSLNE
ncbi:YraN family protein [Erwinia sp. HR93]|uniref:YraN family protein n=1 Tax=Erwinia sp. HR93 TaxID=3094840 RepID=UPI002ADED440|nr:YraN family protein [Erwinia sp. HR93]MEA1063407.1 YraN family protein [Erwinia sp. HR93]